MIPYQEIIVSDCLCCSIHWEKINTCFQFAVHNKVCTHTCNLWSKRKKYLGPPWRNKDVRETGISINNDKDDYLTRNSQSHVYFYCCHIETLVRSVPLKAPLLFPSLLAGSTTSLSHWRNDRRGSCLMSEGRAGCGGAGVLPDDDVTAFGPLRCSLGHLCRSLVGIVSWKGVRLC